MAKNKSKSYYKPGTCYQSENYGKSGDLLHERVIAVAGYIVENNATVRQTAKEFGISKSTVHKDVTDRLTMINPVLAKQVRTVLDINKSERHIRGGMATREKYLHLQSGN